MLTVSEFQQSSDDRPCDRRQGEPLLAAARRFLTRLYEHDAAPINNGRETRMSDFRTTLLENFADAAEGHRRTFAVRGLEHQRVLMRELLYSSRDDVFMLSPGLSRKVYSAAVFRNIVGRTTRPQIRILLDTSPAEEHIDSILSDITELLQPNGPIQIQWLSTPAAVHMVVVDGKHIRLDRDTRDEETVVDLNAPEVGQNALRRLNKLWEIAIPASRRTNFRKSLLPVAIGEKHPVLGR